MKKKVIIETEFESDYQHEIEKIVLGSILINSEIIYEIASEFSIKLFSSPENILIAESIIDLHISNKKIDILLLVENLQKKGNLENCGGIKYISSLTQRIGSTANIFQHIRLLQQYYLSRYINEVCSTAQREILQYKEDIFDVYEKLQQKMEIALKDVLRQEVETVANIHNKIISDAYLLKNTGEMSGVPTGLERLDILTNGWQSSDLIIIAGRPSMGKTAFAVSILINPVIVKKIPIAIFSLEMSKEQLVCRIQSILSEINVSKIIKKQLTDIEIDHIDKSCLDLLKAPLYIDDTANISLMELKTKARKLVRENKVKMIVVDYLQLMRSGLKTNNREQEIAEISKGLKAIAKELNIPVIALSQLSRSVEQRGGDKKPSLSDLRESGQVEQDADMVLFAHRPEYYGFTEYNWGGTDLDCKNLFIAVISKHRNGVIGEIPLAFYGEMTKITNHPDNNFLYQNSIKSSSIQPKNDNFTRNIVKSSNHLMGNIQPKNENKDNSFTGSINPSIDLDSLSDFNNLFENPPF
jgi:replicative DNA helicase